MTKLGENQLGVIRALFRDGDWPGKWTWNNFSQTLRIIKSLERRGLVENYGPQNPDPYQRGSRFRLTRQGLADELQRRNIRNQEEIEGHFRRIGHSYRGKQP